MRSIARDNVLRMPTPVKFELEMSARSRFVLNPDCIADEAMVQMKRAVAQAMFGSDEKAVKFFDLTLAERDDVVEVVNAAWYSLMDLLRGQSPSMSAAEYQCLTFSGPYDRALLEMPPTGTES